LSLQENNAGEYNVSDVDITRENCRVLTSSWIIMYKQCMIVETGDHFLSSSE
jgi:hypothetical protein